MARDFFDELSDTITRTTKDLGKKPVSFMRRRRSEARFPVKSRWYRN